MSTTIGTILDGKLVETNDGLSFVEPQHHLNFRNQFVLVANSLIANTNLSTADANLSPIPCPAGL